MPKTILKGFNYNDNFDSKEILIPAGQNIKLKLKDMLDLIGTDLDLRINEQLNMPAEEDFSVAGNDQNDTVIFPYARISGVNVIWKFQYYQFNLAPEHYKKCKIKL